MKKKPTTLAEARVYRYGKWAGNPNGNSFHEGDCIEEIIPNERGALPRQCASRGNPYCGVHRPGAKEKRAANRPPTRFGHEMAAIDQRERDYRELRRYRRVLKRIVDMRCTCLDESDCAHTVAVKALQLSKKGT